MTARTWSDGFGRWHAIVPATGTPLLAARRVIRDELIARSEPVPVHPHWFLHLERTPADDTVHCVAFAEPAVEPVDCRQCRTADNNRMSVNVRTFEERHGTWLS